MAKKITRGYVNHYQTIKMAQTLPSGRHVFVEYVKTPNDKWVATYSTDSAYHICPYNGQFIDCAQCAAVIEAANDEDIVKNCFTREERISSEEMASRATACVNADGCKIDFLGY